MTGEMGYIDQETGEDDSGNVWGLHAAVAKAVEGQLEPFDVYQGPYILVDDTRLFIGSEDGMAGYVWNETTRQSSKEFPIHEPLAEVVAIAYARQLLGRDG